MPRYNTFGQVLISDIVFKVKKYAPDLSREQIISMFNLDEQKAANNTLELFCLYCNKKLKHKSETYYPYKDVPSIDHMKPKYMGGSNNPDNLALVCHECNIIKSTMDATSFIQLLAVLKQPGNETLKDNFFNQIWQGRIANKIERVNNPDNPANINPDPTHTN